MNAAVDATDATFVAAERVAALLAKAGVESAVIGAIALAAHRYPRSTEDVDLAVGVDPHRLEDLAALLRRDGFVVEVSQPDASDPLGGVLQVTAEGIDRIEVVNFYNPPAGGFPALVDAAVRDAAPTPESGRLRVVRLDHLIVFKLYAGGPKSKSDVLEVLSRNPEIDLHELRETCRRFRMDRKLDAWLRELKEPADQ